MADIQNINMDQASGGCQTVKFNGNIIKKIILDGKTIWQHKSRKVSSYGNPVFTDNDLSGWEAWELETQPDYYDMSNTYLDLYTDYEYDSSKGIRGSGTKITDRRDFQANTWYYHGNGWTDYMYRTKVNFTGSYFGGDTPATWGTDADTGETWYAWHEPASNVTQQTITCSKTYEWVVD